MRKVLLKQMMDWMFALLIASLMIYLVLTQPVMQVSGPVVQKNIAAEVLVQNLPQHLKKHVVQLTEIYTPRTIAYDNQDATAHYIHDQMSVSGHAQYQKYSILNGEYHNVLLELGPRTNEVFVIGAHYDALDGSLQTEGNASGVATLIELAHLLSIHQKELAINVQLVAYPLSKGPTLRDDETGSFIHAMHLKASGRKVRLMVSLDSVGHFSEKQGSQKYPFSFMHLLYPDKGDYISLLGRLQDYQQVRAFKRSFAKASSLALYSLNAPENFPGLAASDHLSYWKLGFPAVLVSDTAKYRKPEDPHEALTEQMDYEKMAMLTRGLYQVVMDTSSQQAPVRLVQQNRNVSDKNHLTRR